jgi:hypothetical protein
VTSIASLTENGLEKGFLTETLDDYDDRYMPCFPLFIFTNI